MIRAYIAIGSNLDDPIQKALDAIATLKTLPKSHWHNGSSLYSSKPMGPSDQPDYVNAVVAIDTELSPLELLNHTQQIEQEFGRVRKAERWGPRTLDLDILLYGNETIALPELVIPHYGMQERNFVLYPLADIAPNLVFPDGCSLNECLKSIEKDTLTMIC